MNEEALAVHKLRQELNSMQLQRQQLDLHLNQKQEAESTFQSQISQLRSEVQEQQNLNSQLNMDLMNLRETNHAEKEMLRERVLQVELETVQYKNELNQRDIVQHQFEEFRKRVCTIVQLFLKRYVHYYADAAADQELGGGEGALGGGQRRSF